MTRMSLARSFAVSAVALAAIIALAGCTTAQSSTPTTRAAQTAAPAAVEPAKPTPGVFNEALAYQSAWHVEAKSTYINATADVCDLNLGISFEDHAALASSDTTIPVYGFVIQHSGDVSYGTVWPTSVPGTGIITGTGTVTFTYDDQGLPASGQGTADLTWHDARQTPAKSHRADQIQLTFTAEPRADHCP